MRLRESLPPPLRAVARRLRSTLRPSSSPLARYVDHSVPAVVLAGDEYPVWVHIVNTSRNAWRRTAGGGGGVDLTVCLDGALQTIGLPRDRVGPGEQVEVSFPLRAPAIPGDYELKLDLVEQRVARFEDLATPPLVLLVRVSSDQPSPDSGHVEKARVSPELARYGAAYIEHHIPAMVPPGTRVGAWVCIENRGELAWDAAPDQQTYISLVVQLDGHVVGTWRLQSRVGRREKTTVHFAFRAPLSPGPYSLQVGLVHQGVCTFEQQGVPPLRLALQVEAASVDPGAGVGIIGETRNPWFYQPSHGVTLGGSGGRFPAFIARGKGCRVWDLAGREYIDYTMGWGSALLGHAHPRITAAMRDVLDSGGLFPFPHPVEMELTETLCDMIPCAEMLVFGKNGSDVCTAAVRLARLYTGRLKVLTCGYHGWQDWFAESFGFDQTGVPAPPEPRVFSFKFNDYVDFRRVLGAHRGEVAAVMLEPAGPGESIQGPAQDADAEFLRQIAADTRKAGGLLIFDEIITGFRYPQHSAQKAFGVVPDLACFGKALGAGTSISALVGRADIFTQAMERTFYGPTFKGEVYPLAAARQALAIYKQEPVAEHVSGIGARLKGEIDALCLVLGVPARTGGPDYRFGLIFSETDPLRLTLIRTLYQQELLRGGVITYNGVMLPSYAHDDEAVGQTLSVVGAALQRVARNTTTRELEQSLEIPLLPA
jgi:glutamate-1-semialdehyde 2,1-aminomutase